MLFRLFCLSSLITASAHSAPLDTATIEQITGVKGAMNTNEGVFKITSPRNDVKVSVDSWVIPPFTGLASWAAFTEQKPGDVMVMGDTVLFQDEVNPAMTVALDNGLAVTALHNHFFFDEPKVYFMHISGMGEAGKLATAVRKIWDKIKEIRVANTKPVASFGLSAMPTTNSITGRTVEDILRAKGQANSGMFKVVIGRTTKMPCGCEMTKEMGVNTWAAFAGTDDNAVVDGDFAVLEDELQPVLKSLRHDSINIVAIHSHMTHENPRILFLHYWGRGPAAKLAESLNRALLVQEGVAFNASPADYELARAKGATVVDVCTATEFEHGHVPGALNLDVNSPDFVAKAAQLDKSKTILVNCHAGIRGARAAAILDGMGFKSVINLDGGLTAWEAAGNKAVK